jgi:non-ribosomal peptide synthetase component F
MLSRRQGSTLFMTLLAGFKAQLLARSGRNDICIATSMANRSQLTTERVIGPLANTTIIRTRIDADLSFQEALSRVRISVLDALANQELPYDILAARLAEEEGLDLVPLTQVFFDVRNAIQRPLKLSNVAVRSFGNADREGQPRLPIDRTFLTLTLKEALSGITGLSSCKSDLFQLDTLEHWIEEYKAILAKAAANPEISLGRLVDEVGRGLAKPAEGYALRDKPMALRAQKARASHQRNSRRD